MMMFIQLLVFTCACALGATDEVPSYADIYDSIIDAYNILQKNIMSMDGNVPFLNDSRRHYAEIIHVVHDEVLKENSCIGKHDYYEDYQKNINISAPFAIAHPQRVVNETNQVITEIRNNIDKVLELLNASAQSLSDTQDIDKAVDEEIKKNVEKFGWSREVFFATGIVAVQLIQDDKDYFAISSQELSAQNFIVTGAPKLGKIVMALKNLNIVMRQHIAAC